MYEIEVLNLDSENKQKSGSGKLLQSSEINDKANKQYIEFVDKVVVVSGASLSASFTLFIALEDNFPDFLRFKIMLFLLRTSMVISVLFGVLTRHYYQRYMTIITLVFMVDGHKDILESKIILKEHIHNMSAEQAQGIEEQIIELGEKYTKENKEADGILKSSRRFYNITMISFIISCFILLFVLSFVLFEY